MTSKRDHDEKVIQDKINKLKEEKKQVVCFIAFIIYSTLEILDIYF